MLAGIENHSIAQTNLANVYEEIFESAMAEPAATFTVEECIDLSWLANALGSGRDACGMDTLAELIAGLSELLTNEYYEDVDLILRSIDLGSISPEVMLAFARTSFAARQKLSEWKEFVSALKRELALRGFDADKLARGLT